MRPHLLGVDHVVILVDDIDAAQAAWSRLGLNLTPRGFHSIGTQNHCMMFGSDYLELLSVIRPHPVTEYFSTFLAQGDGAAAVAFCTDDSQACWESLRASGIEADAPVDFSRPVDSGGRTGDARFRVTQLPVSATPGCRTFLCQHFTPELVWLPPYQQHPLGVTGVAGITMLVDDTPAAAAAYARVAGVDPVQAAQQAKVRIGGFTIDFVRRSEAAGSPPSRPGPAIDALHLVVADPSAAGRVLEQRGFTVRMPDRHSIELAGPPVNGTRLTFHSA